MVGVLANPLVMIVNGNRQRLLRLLLANTRQIKLRLYLGGLRKVKLSGRLLGLRSEFLVENILANDDTTIADVNARTLNQFFHLGMRFAAKTAKSKMGGAGHWF